MPTRTVSIMRVIGLKLRYSGGELSREGKKHFLDGDPIKALNFVPGYNPFKRTRRTLVYLACGRGFFSSTLVLGGKARLVGWIGTKRNPDVLLIDTGESGTVLVGDSDGNFVGIDDLGASTVHYDNYVEKPAAAYQFGKSKLRQRREVEVLIGTTEILARGSAREPWQELVRTRNSEGRTNLELICFEEGVRIGTIDGDKLLVGWSGFSKTKPSRLLVSADAGRGSISFTDSKGRPSKLDISGETTELKSSTVAKTLGIGADFGSEGSTTHQVSLMKAGGALTLLVEGQATEVDWQPDAIATLDSIGLEGQILHVSVGDVLKPEEVDLPEGLMLLGVVPRVGNTGLSGLVLRREPSCQSFTLRREQSTDALTVSELDQAEPTVTPGLVIEPVMFDASEDDGTLTPVPAGSQGVLKVSGTTISLDEGGVTELQEEDLEPGVIATMKGARVIVLYSDAFSRDGMEGDHVPDVQGGATLIAFKNGRVVVAVKSHDAVVTVPDGRDDSSGDRQQFKFTHLMTGTPTGTLQDKPAEG